MASIPIKASNRARELARTGALAFVGEIRKVGASNVKLVKATKDVATVRVVADLGFPPELAHLSSNDVTVRLLPGSPRREGTRAIFFATGWIYAENVALTEIGRMDRPSRVADARRLVFEARQRVRDDTLHARLTKASLVVTGTVVTTHPLAEKRHGQRGRHDPEWWQATVAVTGLLKGSSKRKSLDVLFPYSKNETWLPAPKFQPGQTGIWILQRNQKEKGLPRFRRAGLTALNPLDYQDIEQLERVRILLVDAT